MKIGTKAENLIKLQNLGYFVPRFQTVLFSDIIIDFKNISKNTLSAAKTFLDGKISPKQYATKIKKIINELELNEPQIKAIFAELTNQGFHKVSFRTSALGEDGTKLSFAGQYRSFLNKKLTRDNMRKYIKECFLSTIDARIVLYLKNHKSEHLLLGGSVIIQQMFYGEKCGVLFTEDGAGNITINTTDSWRNIVVEGSSAKAFKLKKNNLQGSNAPRILKKLSQKSVQLENTVGTPLDIEWSISGKKIAFLQMRPQTVRPINYFFEWDNTNISESYPGVTLPLTYSFIRNLYAKVYPSFLSMIGISNSVLEENSEVFNNALGFLDGRVYYRISNWYEIIKLIPGKNNQQYFEAMLNPAKKRNPKKKREKTDARSLYIMIRFLWMFVSSPRFSRKFKKRFNERFVIYNNSKIEFMNASALLRDIQSVQKELLSLWAIPILNDVRVMIWHGILKNTVTKAADHDTYLDLLRGLSYRTSIKPIQALRTLGLALNKEMVKSKTPSINKLVKNPAARNLVQKYISEYSARTPDELKLENPRLVDSLEDIISMALKAKDNEIKPLGKPKTDLSKFSFGKRLLLRIIIKNTRNAIDWREHFRLNRAQVFNLARNAYLQIGERFAKDKIIISKEDIFYLTDFEIENIINGHAWEYKTTSLITHRKEQFTQYGKKEMPRRTTGEGLVAARHLTAMPAAELSNSKNSGIGTSPGTITAKVIVATEFNPNLDVRGKILIAPHIDPGWTLIFTQAIGIIAERGNALSHVSIISRELGIPAVVAVRNATKNFKTGQTITINGSTGEIFIHGKK